MIVVVVLAIIMTIIIIGGTGRNRDGVVEWRFGDRGLSRFATYDSPLYPSNREARRAAARERK